jgi:hypothetical protein
VSLFSEGGKSAVRSASAVAKGDSELVIISKEVYLRSFQHNHKDAMERAKKLDFFCEFPTDTQPL